MNSIATPCLYRTYRNMRFMMDKTERIDPWGPFTPFLETLCKHPELASHVETLHIREWDSASRRTKGEALELEKFDS